MIKRKYNILIGFFLLVATALPVWAQENLPDLVKQIKPSVVTIITYDSKDKALSQGSGFFINTHHIISNRHVLQGAYRAEVKINNKTSNGKLIPELPENAELIISVGGVLAEDKEGDLILLDVERPSDKIKPLTVVKTLPQEGEKILVIGSPLGLEQSVSDGIVSAVRDIPNFGKIIQITAPISPGSSGSPVINMKGEIIGIATLQIIKGQNLNFAIPGERAAALKPGKLQRLAEWTTGTTREGLASAEGLYSKGLLFLWSEDYKTALSYFEKAVKEKPSYTEAWFYRGYCLGKLGRWREEVEAFRQAIRLKPDYAEAYLGLGLAYNILGHGGEAMEAFKQAIRLKPDFSLAHYSLGLTYIKLGRYSEAVEAFKQAIRLKPDDAEAHLGLGITYLILDDKGSALEEYRILKTLDPNRANELFNLIYK